MLAKSTSAVDFTPATTPVAFVPQQLFPQPAHRPWEGERRLMLAILEEAIQSYRRTISKRAWRSREDREPELWIFADDPSWCFSFINICGTLGLEPTAIRSALAHEKPRQQSLFTRRSRN